MLLQIYFRHKRDELLNSFVLYILNFVLLYVSEFVMRGFCGSCIFKTCDVLFRDAN